MSFTERNSPFYPGVIVSAKSFAGREEELKMFERSVAAVVNGGQVRGVLITGERGVGKSSFSKYVANLYTNKDYMNKPLSSLLVNMNSAYTFEDFVLEIRLALLEKMRKQSGIWKKLGKLLYSGLGKINGVGDLGVNAKLNLSEEDKKLLVSSWHLEQSLIEYTRGIISEENDGGLMIILDNVSGVVKDDRVPDYLKGLLETISRARDVPFLLVINALPSTWNVVAKKQPSAPRSYNKIELQGFKDETVAAYFRDCFEKVKLQVPHSDMKILIYASGGIPLSMQFVGDGVFWACDGKKVTKQCIRTGIVEGVRRVGNRYLNEQLFSTMRSKRYKNVLLDPEFIQFENDYFQREDIKKIVDKHEQDKKRAYNITGSFIKKMCKIGVLKPGEEPATWKFKNGFIRVYLGINAFAPSLDETRKKNELRKIKEFFTLREHPSRLSVLKGCDHI